MRVSLIVAAAENGTIGHEGKMPWHLPADLKHFKTLTMGHPVLMGRKTFDSIGKPLPGRRNLMISRNEQMQIAGVEIFPSIAKALDTCDLNPEIFIIGGGSIYDKVLDMDIVDRIYLTLIHHGFEGDTFFHLPHGPGWDVVHKERHEADERNPYPFTFLTLDRKR